MHLISFIEQFSLICTDYVLAHISTQIDLIFYASFTDIWYFHFEHTILTKSGETEKTIEDSAWYRCITSILLMRSRETRQLVNRAKNVSIDKT